MAIIRIVVVDDHRVINDGLKAVLAQTDDIDLVASAVDCESAATLIARLRPDVVLTDVMFEREPDGLSLVRQMARYPDAPAFLILSSFTHDSLYATAIAAGAAGYIAKSASADELIAAIRTVARGGTAYPMSAIRSAGHVPVIPSERELEVISLVAGGAANAEIGQSLGITEKTVESHLRRLFTRYAVMSRTELAMLAMRHGWIAEDGPRRPITGRSGPR